MWLVGGILWVNRVAGPCTYATLGSRACRATWKESGQGAAELIGKGFSSLGVQLVHNELHDDLIKQKAKTKNNAANDLEQAITQHNK